MSSDLEKLASKASYLASLLKTHPKIPRRTALHMESIAADLHELALQLREREMTP